MLNDRQIIEFFHLQFLRILRNHLDASLYVIKGGCNLRFFFESIRYSEDIDLDVHTISQQTLKKKIDTILGGNALRQSLSLQDTEITQFSAPKQTQTVQRWKVALRGKNRAIDIPTKIEFSRREFDQDYACEPVGGFLLQTYRLPPLILPHYYLGAAIEQKIQALLNRNITQARDIFDLDLLLSKLKDKKLLLDIDIDKASDIILSVSFNDFSSQVVAYLVEEEANYYKDPDIWQKMQLNLIDTLNLLIQQ